MRALVSTAILSKMSGLNPGRLKRSKSWEPFWMYIPANQHTANLAAIELGLAMLVDCFNYLRINFK